MIVKVLVRKQLITQLPEYPPPGYGLAALPQQEFEEYELLWPKNCPCCAASVESGSTLLLSKSPRSRLSTLNTHSPGAWRVPYCKGCLHHVALKQQRPASSMLVELSTLLLAILMPFSLLSANPLLAVASFMLVVLGGFIFNGWLLRRYKINVVQPSVDQDCSTDGPAITYLGWNEDRTQQIFSFASEDYAKHFESLNQKLKSG